jgi:hypothetical protein
MHRFEGLCKNPHDLIWEADMCFSKPDIGMSLPWILHVADTGALQFFPPV